MIGVVAAILVTLIAVLDQSSLFEHRFTLARESEVVATIRGGCERCDWRTEGREAAAIEVTLDGRYSQHIMLLRGSTPADYRVVLGRLAAGDHVVGVALDRAKSAPGIGATTVASIQIESVDAGSRDALALSMAPVLHARPDTIGRFTDVPALMWYETVSTARGRQIRYSVIFTNEDGGTPTDRLMATWGRTTDIEYVYGVELDSSDTVMAEEYQGPEHEILPHRGRHEARHPLLWVATHNNMVTDRGDVAVRYAPAPVAFDLTMKSREAVMDANPWTYGVMAAEIAREGRIRDAPPVGSGNIPDLRRFVFVEACTDLENAALSFGVRVAGSGGARWFQSDGGLPEFRIVRSGCFRGAVAVPGGAAPDAVRFNAFVKPRKPADPPSPPGRVQLLRVNAVFTLDARGEPQPSLLSTGDSHVLVLDGDGVVMPIRGK